MSESPCFILGFDPGGVGNFGWSVCREAGGLLQPPPLTGVADDALDALNQSRAEIPYNATVRAAGIDAPLFWGKRGNRQIDNELNRQMLANDFPQPANGGRIIQAVNSLRGGCVVQGPLLVRYLRDTWDQLPITESHPKALQWLLPILGQFEAATMARRMIAGLVEHRLDATLCAVAAWGMMYHENLPGWQNFYDQEPNGIEIFDGPVGYWMPIP